ncbi:hypothetical protein FSP39_000280 [Pinctada imbricata]|uniref:tRNA-uridine aminocarboxypropyltransferase n=1 Tax=Pinctada imbricata TaxID=66713 RepID=A0AA89C681_PINIB|nr:hypothetical protein FSP39_000280 [Pinctada imbricata]
MDVVIFEILPFGKYLTVMAPMTVCWCPFLPSDHLIVLYIRPMTVCWCPFLPSDRLPVSTTVYILQHPFEESRNLRTAPMLMESLPPGKCHIIKGKKFPQHRYTELASILQDPMTLLLYPDPEAVNITDVPPPRGDNSYNLVLLDGTWAQAKNMYLSNDIFKLPQKVRIEHSSKSKYVIRTQPDDGSLSTLECAAVALSVLEGQPSYIQILTRPLEALCDFQIQYGACKHDSKVFKIENGLWHKRLPRKLLKRMEEKKKQDNSPHPDKEYMDEELCVDPVTNKTLYNDEEQCKHNLSKNSEDEILHKNS